MQLDIDHPGYYSHCYCRLHRKTYITQATLDFKVCCIVGCINDISSCRSHNVMQLMIIHCQLVLYIKQALHGGYNITSQVCIIQCAGDHTDML